MIGQPITLFWRGMIGFGGLCMIYFAYQGEVPVENVSNAKKPLSQDERIGMFLLGVAATMFTVILSL